MLIHNFNDMLFLWANPGQEDILFDYLRLFEEKKEEGTDRVIVHYIDEV